jgi:hypothetical protein
MNAKFIFAIGSVVVLTASSFTLTNDCSNYEQFTKGTKYTTSMYDGKGKLNSTVNCTTDAVTVSADKTVADISVIMNDGEGKQSGTAAYQLTCTGTSYMMDLKGIAAAAAVTDSRAKGMDMQFEGDMLDYPAVMVAGQSLTGGNIIMKMMMNGMVMSTTTVTIKDRKVEKIEDKTTSAGTWSCYKITYTTSGVTKMNFMGKSSETQIEPEQHTEWFSFKVGPVRTENYKNGALEGYTELTAFTKGQ